MQFGSPIPAVTATALAAAALAAAAASPAAAWQEGRNAAPGRQAVDDLVEQIGYNGTVIDLVLHSLSKEKGPGFTITADAERPRPWPGRCAAGQCQISLPDFS